MHYDTHGEALMENFRLSAEVILGSPQVHRKNSRIPLELVLRRKFPIRILDMGEKVFSLSFEVREAKASRIHTAHALGLARSRSISEAHSRAGKKLPRVPNTL